MTTKESVPYPFLKWLTDKVIPLFIILLATPILIVIIVGMALDMLLCPADRGAWFYRERRMSRGKEFDVLKFRVLREDVLARMRQEGKQHARLYEDDLENLTWVGRYLKKWYFDEAPQLINILKGEMSLVGPRPWPLEMVKAQEERGVIYRRLILAGWTGPTQLQKGNPTPLNGETLDLEYLSACRTWSAWRLWLYDLDILYQTIGIMLQGKGLKY